MIIFDVNETFNPEVKTFLKTFELKSSCKIYQSIYTTKETKTTTIFGIFNGFDT